MDYLTATNKRASSEDDESFEIDSRYRIRMGIRMVLEDRLAKAWETGTMRPVHESLDYISDNAKGFTVSLICCSNTIINGEEYTGRDGVIVVKEDNKPLIYVYKEKVTGATKLWFDEFNFLPLKEQQFYNQLNELLKGPDGNEDQYLSKD